MTTLISILKCYPVPAHLIWSYWQSNADRIIYRENSHRSWSQQFIYHHWRTQRLHCWIFELTDLWKDLNCSQTSNPDAALIVAGDFNQANLKKDGHRAKSRPVFGKSDYAAILLRSTYVNKLRHMPPVMREVRKWTSQSEATLQSALHGTVWTSPLMSEMISMDSLSLRWTSFVKQQKQLFPKIQLNHSTTRNKWITRTMWGAINTPCSLRFRAADRKHGQL